LRAVRTTLDSRLRGNDIALVSIHVDEVIALVSIHGV
jgi:hypothetical protein